MHILGYEEINYFLWPRSSKVFLSCGFLLDGKNSALRTKTNLKEFEMVRSKHQEDSNVGKEAMILFFGLQDGLKKKRARDHYGQE